MPTKGDTDKGASVEWLPRMSERIAIQQRKDGPQGRTRQGFENKTEIFTSNRAVLPPLPPIVLGYTQER